MKYVYSRQMFKKFILCTTLANFCSEWRIHRSITFQALWIVFFLFETRQKWHCVCLHLFEISNRKLQRFFWRKSCSCKKDFITYLIDKRVKRVLYDMTSLKPLINLIKNYSATSLDCQRSMCNTKLLTAAWSSIPYKIRTVIMFFK